MAIKKRVKRQDLSDYAPVNTQSRVPRYSQRWHDLKGQQMKYVKLYDRALGMGNRKKQREHYAVITKYEKELDIEMRK
jgi:hypothetical protein